MLHATTCFQAAAFPHHRRLSRHRLLLTGFPEFRGSRLAYLSTYLPEQADAQLLTASKHGDIASLQSRMCVKPII